MIKVPWLWRGRQSLSQSLIEQQARFERLCQGENAMALLLAAWRFRLLDRDIARWRASGSPTECGAKEKQAP